MRVTTWRGDPEVAQLSPAGETPPLTVDMVRHCCTVLARRGYRAVVTGALARAEQHPFFADGFGSGSMRLSYCYPTPERIREGVRRLAGVLEAEMELRETFGASAPARGLEARSGYDSPGSDLS